jgi:hypothetical protein
MKRDQYFDILTDGSSTQIDDDEPYVGSPPGWKALRQGMMKIFMDGHPAYESASQQVREAYHHHMHGADNRLEQSDKRRRVAAERARKEWQQAEQQRAEQQRAEQQLAELKMTEEVEVVADEWIGFDGVYTYSTDEKKAPHARVESTKALSPKADPEKDMTSVMSADKAIIVAEEAPAKVIDINKTFVSFAEKLSATGVFSGTFSPSLKAPDQPRLRTKSYGSGLRTFNCRTEALLMEGRPRSASVPDEHRALVKL